MVALSRDGDDTVLVPVAYSVHIYICTCELLHTTYIGIQYIWCYDMGI